MYNDGMSTSNSASSMTSSLPFDTISFTENIKDDCFRDLGISSGNGSRMTNSNSTQPVAIPNDWNNDKYLQIPTSTTLRPSVSTSHVSRCTCQSHRPSIVKLSYQNANVSYSTNSLAHGNQQHCNNRKLIASPKIYSNKMPSVGPNGRILVKGATFGERVAVSFDDELSCGSMECRQNRSCDWSTSQGNLLEYKPQHVTPANNQIAQELEA
uniref:IPT/TIG domain-containing protein n=1 Tax=Rhabditophanes sp. KR3021 TaxID=114890 RepID=A0AC35U1N1_9BILA